MPKDPASRSRVRIWIDYRNTRLQQAAGYVAHDYKVEPSKQRIREYLGTVDREMAARQYIAGDYSLADITYIPFFCRLERYRTTIDGSTPRVKAWMNRLLARPTVRSTP